MKGEMIKIESGQAHSGKCREVIVRVGNTYRIEPLNPRKLKNRGRMCRVISFRAGDRRYGSRVNVVWLDTDERGWTDVEDFVQVTLGDPVESAT